MTIQQRLMERVKDYYFKNNIPYGTKDKLAFGYIIYIVPSLFFLPAMFFFFKWLFITRLLATKGFEETIIYIAIMMLIRPIIQDILSPKIQKLIE